MTRELQYYHPEPQYYHCNCNQPSHTLLVLDDQEDGITYVDVGCHPADVRLSERIRAAWAILLGQEHILTEIVLCGEEREHFLRRNSREN